jgi:Zn-dependent protease with chaperone function
MIPGLALALALSPGLFAWLLGRRLLAHGSEETLPERLLAQRMRIGQAAAIVLAALLLLAGAHNAWALPLFSLVLLAGSFPARRAVLEESWKLPAYVSHMVRFIVGGFGFFVLLAATPALVHAMGGPSAFVLLLVLAGWATGSTHVFLFLARATPLDRPDLVPHLDRVVAASGCKAPRLYRAGPAGGRFVNAFAFPSEKNPSVLFTNDLLAHFTPEETAAVFAHEMAHLEHYDKKKLRRRGLVVLLLIAVAVFVTPHFARILPSLAPFVLGGWALAIAVAVPASLAAHRSHEADSDRRAVALCGDAEALVRALVKLTTLARMPRRWALDFEQHSSHPSLARRIQAIRQAAGTGDGSAAASTVVVLPGREPGRFVVLEGARAHWLEGAPAGLVGDPNELRLAAARVRSHAYAELAELHVDVSKGHASLRAVTTSGEKWTVDLEPGVVAATQAALDRIDVSLAVHEAPRTLPPIFVNLVALVILLFGLTAGHPLLVMPVSLVAQFRGGPASLGAAGATAVGAALLSLARPSALTKHSTLSLVGLLIAGLLGLAIAWLLFKQSVATRARGARAAAIVTAVVAAGSLVGLAWAATLSHPGLRLHQAAAGPAPIASLLALSAALLFGASRHARLAALLPLGATVVLTGLGTEAFASRFSDDPFAASAPPAFRESPLQVIPLHEQRLTGSGGGLRISPSGRAFALRVWDEADEEAPSLFRVGAFGGAAHDFDAEEVRLVDDEHVLVLAHAQDGDTLELRLASVTPGGPERWRISLPSLDLPHLAIDPPTGTWRVSGSRTESRETWVVSGRIGSAAKEEARLPWPRGLPLLTAVGRHGGLGVRTSADPKALHAMSWPVFLLMGPSYPVESEVSRLTAEGADTLGLSGLRVQCPPPAIDDVFLCLADDGVSTRVFEADIARGRFEVRGSVPGQLVPWELGPAGRLYAWSAAQGSVVVDVPARTMRTVPVPGAGAIALAGTANVLGVLRYDGSASVVASYRTR